MLGSLVPWLAVLVPGWLGEVPVLEQVPCPLHELGHDAVAIATMDAMKIIIRKLNQGYMHTDSVFTKQSKKEGGGGLREHNTR